MESNENEAYQTKKHVLIIPKVLIWSLDIRIRIVSLFSDSNCFLLDIIYSEICYQNTQSKQNVFPRTHFPNLLFYGYLLNLGLFAQLLVGFFSCTSGANYFEIVPFSGTLINSVRVLVTSTPHKKRFKVCCLSLPPHQDQ